MLGAVLWEVDEVGDPVEKGALLQIALEALARGAALEMPELAGRSPHKAAIQFNDAQTDAAPVLALIDSVAAAMESAHG